MSGWARRGVRDRCRTVASAADTMRRDVDAYLTAATNDQRVDPVDSITAELIPTLDALRWIGRRGPRVLRCKRLSVFSRPAWLWGVRTRVCRVPVGEVLILGAWNYPLFLTAVQAAQSLAAGNRTLVKPAPGAAAVTDWFVGHLHRAGVPETALVRLDDSVRAGTDAIDRGVDLVVMTGSAGTGRAVMRRCAETLTPTIVEAGGCDAVVVLPGADVRRVADTIRFGLTINSGATCIGPRRILVPGDEADTYGDAIDESLADADIASVHPAARSTAADALADALDRGASGMSPEDVARLRRDGRMLPVLMRDVEPEMTLARSDVFAPVASLIRYADVDAAADIVNACPYRLAASVFGPRRSARRLADRLDVGTVVINELIVPTADPRMSFGGRGRSGFGVTRGAEGLLAMTAVKNVCQRVSGPRMHLRPRRDGDERLMRWIASRR